MELSTQEDTLEDRLRTIAHMLGYIGGSSLLGEVYDRVVQVDDPDGDRSSITLSKAWDGIHGWTD